MRNCLSLRSHSGARISLHQVRHALLDTERKLLNHKPIPTNALPLIQAVGLEDEELKADQVIKNATFVHGSANELKSVAVSNGFIAKIGDFADLEALIDRDTTITDISGKTLLPGFCDSHFHLIVGAERHQGVDVEDVTTIEDFRERVSSFLKNHPELPAIHVYGLHYFDTPIIPAATARQVLDEIVDDRPLFVYAHDLHTGWANTKAVELAGLLREMPPFPRMIEELELTGNIELDKHGLPTGEFREPDVYFLVEGPIRETYPLTAEQKLDYLREVFQKLASLGLTSIHNMGLALPEEDIELLILLLELEQRGELPIRVHCAYSIVPDEHMLTDIHYASLVRDKLRQAREGHISPAELHEFLLDTLTEVTDLRHEHALNLHKYHPRLEHHEHMPFIHGESERLRSHIHTVHVSSHIRRKKERMHAITHISGTTEAMVDLGGVKIFMDGVIEKDTAFRLDQEPLHGIPAFDDYELEQLVTNSDRAGLQVAAHCIGDGSVHAILNAVETARQKNAQVDGERGHQIRHRIEHIEMCKPDDIERFSELNVTPSMQPLHQRPPMTMWHEKVPRDNWPYAFPWRNLLETGVMLSFGSDWPIVSCNCLDGMHRAVNRRPWAEGMPDGHLTKSEVVDAFSKHPAYLEYREKLKGQISPGMVADLIILSDNIHGVAPENVDQLQVEQAFSGGCQTYQR